MINLTDLPSFFQERNGSVAQKYKIITLLLVFNDNLSIIFSMVQAICQTILNIRPLPSHFPKYDKISWKALAVLGTLGALLMLAYYLHKPRVSVVKTNEPVAPTVKTIRVEKLKNKIQKILLPTECLGKAADNGDCFYDALATALKQIGITVSCKKLRLDIAEALNTPKWAEKIKHSISQDPRSIDNFENYQNCVSFTHDELEKLRKTDPQAPDPYWGGADREGLILCEKYQFNLRIISAGCMETLVENDKEYQKYTKGRAEDLDLYSPEAPIHKMNEEKIQNRLIELYQQNHIYYNGDETYPKGAPYERTCTLALYENHFVPVLAKP